MVESVALEPRVRLPHNGRRFLDYVSSPLAYLSRVVSSIRGREVGIYPNDSAPPIQVNKRMERRLSRIKAQSFKLF